jgi:site-specific DNA-methyltransferase (adenine-specific)
MLEEYKNKIICCDSLEFMRKLPDRCVDLVLTDPPYGITKAEWDTIPKKEYFDEIFRISKNQIIFGGNYFDLPKKEGWLIWDKMLEDNPSKKWQTSNAAEFMWSSSHSKVEIIRFLYNGNIQAFKGEKKKPNYNIGKAVFSSQKPIRLIKRLVGTYTKENDIILDPFLGSGTTAVACQTLHRNFIGIEISPEYCAIANKRLAQKPLL